MKLQKHLHWSLFFMISLQGFEKLIGFAENKWHNKVHRYDAKINQWLENVNN